MSNRPSNIDIHQAKHGLVGMISALVTSIPKHHNEWSQQQAANFKSVTEAAHRYIQRKRHTMPALARFHAMLRGFHK